MAKRWSGWKIRCQGACVGAHERIQAASVEEVAHRMTQPVDTRSRFVRLSGYVEFPEGEMKERASAFLDEAQRRRTVRDFSDRPIPRDVIEMCVLAAGTAPNGAHRQPWTARCQFAGTEVIKAKLCVMR